MANGEWRMASGEWRVANGEWRIHVSFITTSLFHYFTISRNKKGIHVEPLFVNLQGKF